MQVTRFLIRVTLFLLAPLVASIATYIVLQRVFLAPIDTVDKEVKLFEISTGKNFKDVCKDLEQGKFVNKWWVPFILSKVTQNDSRRVKAGEYQIARSMTPLEILKKIFSGEVFTRVVLVKEGATINEIAKIVRDAGLANEIDFIQATTDSKLLKTAGIKGDSFEGYLFPETYHFSRPIKAKDIVWRMLEEGDKNWLPQFTERANELNLSRHEILTLASIIEKESGNKDEQPMISSVFHNRLNQGMRLQADPTVIYGIKNFDGDIKKAGLLNPHPYNTYVNFGLPPGPIASPGNTAIRAALFPIISPNLFFVADGKGGHVFSATLAEHNEAVARYQLKQKQ